MRSNARKEQVRFFLDGGPHLPFGKHSRVAVPVYRIYGMSFCYFFSDHFVLLIKPCMTGLILSDNIIGINEFPVCNCKNAGNIYL